ncbi:MAG: 50S ribosomal protein L3 [Candidatus Omnitrophica bacterium]|nr:50S ribosomal protein L3 [Candidatus Omnitrophota bacterium]
MSEEKQNNSEESKAENVEHTIGGLIGRKIGMSQIFDADRNRISVTVIETGPCTVLELKDDATIIKIGFGAIKESRAGKAKLGLFKKIGAQPTRTIREFKSTKPASYKVGQEITVDLFKAGDYVDIIGTSIGKSFQGGMKRHGWSGGPAGHGSMHHRRVGSISMSAEPSRTLRGRTMPGHMGDRRITTQGLRVMDVDKENNLILVKGAVPGSKNGIISILLSRKKVWKDLYAKKEAVQHKVNPMKQSKAKAGATKKKGK